MLFNVRKAPDLMIRGFFEIDGLLSETADYERSIIMQNEVSGTGKTGKRNSSGGISIRELAFIGMLAAIAEILMLIEIPLPFAPSFYELDISEMPVLIGTFAYGPVAGIFIELIKVLLHFVIKGTQTAGVGELANFLIGCALLVPAGFIYKSHKSKKEALIGMAAGTLCMTVAGCLMNAFVLLPVYAAAFGMPIDALVAMGTKVNANVKDLFGFVMLCVAPFNLLKGVVVSLITFLLYKRISGILKHETYSGKARPADKR